MSGAAAARRWRGPAALIVGLLVLWQLLYLLAGEVALRTPAQTVAYTLSLVPQDAFWTHVEESATAFGAALAIAVASGLAIGLLLGFHRLSGDVGEPMLVAVYSIPKVTLYPIVLLAFGLGMPAKIAFGAIHGFVPIALFTINAVRNIRPILVKTGRVLRLGPIETATRILLPAALPEIFTGLRIGFALTLIGTLLGEMFASQRGLGYMLMNAIGLHNVDVIMSVTFLLIVFAAVVSSILLRIDRALHRRF
ncbi:MAG TPA: ABC transporter permease subunit [Thermodesulfobacteriota bacterium]